MYGQDRCVRDSFASVFFIKLHQNREVLIGMHCIESLQGILCMRKLILKEGLFERMAVYKTYKLAVFSSCCFVHLRWWSFSWFIFQGGQRGGQHLLPDGILCLFSQSGHRVPLLFGLVIGHFPRGALGPMWSSPSTPSMGRGV